MLEEVCTDGGLMTDLCCCRASRTALPVSLMPMSQDRLAAHILPVNV